MVEEVEVELCVLKLLAEDTVPLRKGTAIIARRACANHLNVVRQRSANLSPYFLRICAHRGPLFGEGSFAT